MRAPLTSLTMIAAVTLLLLAAPARAAELSPADRQAVDEIVAQSMDTARLPGVTLRITGPKGTYVKAYGEGNRATHAPITVDDTVRIASITKSFTATAVLRQVQRGRLSLSDTLSTWVEGVPNGKRITVRQLLAMRSGIFDFTSDPDFDKRFAANPRMAWKPADILPIIRRHKPLFAPGARTQYADSNYVLLGMILEKVTGRSVESVITRDVIRPAGLRHTSFPTTPAMPRPFAHGYYAGNDGTDPTIRDYTFSNPKVAWTAGGMVSTLGDLVRWGRVLARGTLLTKAMQAQRLRFGTIPNPGPPVGYGLGILRVGDWIGHDGAIFGYSTATFYGRSTGAQIAVIGNLSSNSTTPTLDVAIQIDALLYPDSLK